MSFNGNEGEFVTLNDASRWTANYRNTIQPGDVIAVLGKGHEKGQEIAGIKHPFDDRKVLAEAIAGGK